MTRSRTFRLLSEPTPVWKGIVLVSLCATVGKKCSSIWRWDAFTVAFASHHWGLPRPICQGRLYMFILSIINHYYTKLPNCEQSLRKIPNDSPELRDPDDNSILAHLCQSGCLLSSFQVSFHKFMLCFHMFSTCLISHLCPFLLCLQYSEKY